MEATALKIIENYCKRKFASATYTREEYMGSGTQYLNLKNYPIVTFSKIEENTATVEAPSWSTMTEVYAIAESGLLYYRGGFFPLEREYRVTYTAGYSPIPSDIQYCIDTLSSYLERDISAQVGIKKETLGEYSYEKFDSNTESSNNPIKTLGLEQILNFYRVPTV
jgi:hypothetical protein